MAAPHLTFMLIRDAENKQKARLHELRTRAAGIGRRTGYEPMSPDEYRRSTPREEPKTLSNMIFGGAIGLALGVMVGLAFMELLLPLAISLAVVGATVGVFADTELTRRDALIKNYEHYLNDFEATAAKEHGLSQGIAFKTTHAADLLVDRTVSPLITR